MKVFIVIVSLSLMSIMPWADIQAVELAAKPVEEQQTVVLAVQNMTCPMCKITLRKALENVEGVHSAKVDYEAKTVQVVFDPTRANIEMLTQATGNAGYPSSVAE